MTSGCEQGVGTDLEQIGFFVALQSRTADETNDDDNCVMVSDIAVRPVCHRPSPYQPPPSGILYS